MNVATAHQSDKTSVPREVMEFDIVVVGAGPAGLATAIRLMQKSRETGQEVSVCLLEKGSEVGAHILSGAVIDPIAINQLFPDWRNMESPLSTEVKSDQLFYLSRAGSISVPHFLLPGIMKNDGNYIVSLSDMCRWLGAQAEEQGVEVIPGFAASELLIDDNNRVYGVATGDMGLDKTGTQKASYERGVELHAKYTVLAEGARGSLSKQAIAAYKLDRDSDVMKYGIGLKELWQVKPELHRPGHVQHTLGWPLDNQTGGGSFIYHYGDNLVSIGFVVHLNYKNPYLSPFNEFQKFKTHPKISPLLEGGKRLSFGARALTEGGWQSVPKLSFPGGLLVGCAAGFMNVPRIKGSHNAMLSGIMAADAILEALQSGRSHDELSAVDQNWRKGDIGRDLKPVRNAKPMLSRLGTLAGMALAGADMWLQSFGLNLFGTWRHGKPDHECLQKAAECPVIEYPAPDGKLTFDRLSSVFLSGTNHEENQPVHLSLKDVNTPLEKNLPDYAEPAQRYCPAAVYEVITGANGEKRFQINAQNCVHCKTCDIKDPAQNITWTTPEGGGGPNYSGM